jgi:hypothetical protein
MNAQTNPVFEKLIAPHLAQRGLPVAGFTPATPGTSGRGKSRFLSVTGEVLTGNSPALAGMALLLALLAATAGCASTPPVYSYTRANPESQMTQAKGSGYDFMVSPGWQPMEGVSTMKKGEQFHIPLDWLGIELGARAQDTSGYSSWGFEFGNLRAVYRKPGKGGALVVFTSWGGTRDSLPEGIKRYLDSIVPDNKEESLVPQRIIPDKSFPLIRFYQCREVKEGKPVTFNAVLGWKWTFSRMYTFAGFYPSDEGAGAVTKDEKARILAEILDMAGTMK